MLIIESGWWIYVCLLYSCFHFCVYLNIHVIKCWEKYMHDSYNYFICKYTIYKIYFSFIYKILRHHHRNSQNKIQFNFSIQKLSSLQFRRMLSSCLLLSFPSLTCDPYLGKPAELLPPARVSKTGRGRRVVRAKSLRRPVGLAPKEVARNPKYSFKGSMPSSSDPGCGWHSI